MKLGKNERLKQNWFVSRNFQNPLDYKNVYKILTLVPTLKRSQFISTNNENYDRNKMKQNRNNNYQLRESFVCIKKHKHTTIRVRRE